MKFLILILVSALGCTFFKPLSAYLQSACGHLVPDGPFESWQRALVCGIRPRNENLKMLQHLGISHLIVVSGAHLIFISQILHGVLRAFRTKPSPLLETSVLVIYGLAAGMQPPVVRALFQNFRKLLNGHAILLSGVLSILFFRELSLSLALSWACAILMSWPTIKKQNVFTKSFFVYVGLFPLLMPLGTASLWSALLNPIAIAGFGLILFPLTVANLVLPLDLICDLAWHWFLKLCAIFSEHLPLTQTQSTSLSVLLYIVALQTLCVWCEVRTQRKRLWGTDLTNENHL